MNKENFQKIKTFEIFYDDVLLNFNVHTERNIKTTRSPNVNFPTKVRTKSLSDDVIKQGTILSPMEF